MGGLGDKHRAGRQSGSKQSAASEQVVMAIGTAGQAGAVVIKGVGGEQVSWRWTMQ